MSSGSTPSSASESGSGFSEYLDLARAFKRKRMQHVGLIWKNRECLVVVRKKKPFKSKMLKGLRGMLSEKAQRGSRRSLGMLVAESKSYIQFLFQEGADYPAKRTLVLAISRQLGLKVKVEIATYKDDPREALESLKNKGKG